MNLPNCYQKDDCIIGCIQYIDSFGNLVTNIPQNWLKGSNWSLEIRGDIIKSGKTYSDAKQGDFITLIGSHGWVDIALNCGNAQVELGVENGSQVRIFLKN